MKKIVLLMSIFLVSCLFSSCGSNVKSDNEKIINDGNYIEIKSDGKLTNYTYPALDQLIESIEDQEKKELVLKILYTPTSTELSTSSEPVDEESKKEKMKQMYIDAFDRAEELIEMSTDDLQKLAEEAEAKAKSAETDFDKKPGYEQLLNRVIAEKNEEIRLAEEKGAGDNYFIVTKEMKEDPKYREPDGSLNYETICKDLGFSLTLSPEGALNEIYLTVADGSIGPHVLGHAEAAVYSDEEGEAWSLKKGDKITFRVYADKEYYQSSGRLYFGALKMGEPFLVDNLDKGITVETETEFEYDVSEAGEYCFYLFCGSTEPIVIKWIYITIR